MAFDSTAALLDRGKSVAVDRIRSMNTTITFH